MTTWTDTTSNQTAWRSTLNTVQVIELVDSDYNFDYPLVDINGRSQRVWNATHDFSTTWRSA